MGFTRNSITIVDDWVFGADYAQSILQEHFNVHSLKGFGVDSLAAGVQAAGGLMHYLQETQKGRLPQIRKIERLDESEFMTLDVQTLRNLELVSSTIGKEG